MDGETNLLIQAYAVRHALRNYQPNFIVRNELRELYCVGVNHGHCLKMTKNLKAYNDKKETH